MNAHTALEQYKSVDTRGNIEDASPHQLIQMLMDGALDRIAKAKGCIIHKNVAEKGTQISKAISIIGGLQGSLDMGTKGDIAANLDSLYDYMTRRLFDASRDNDAAALDEVTSLLKEIRTAWDAIPAEHHHKTAKK